jgi:pullulanase/glycogen debranching enzyme
VILQRKLIAEPWDLGDGGYQIGNFPVLWTEWHGRYRTDGHAQKEFMNATADYGHHDLASANRCLCG